MGLFNLFGGKAAPQPDVMIEVKDRCGILINTQAGDNSYLWIVQPFWNTGQPVVVNGPDRKIRATIVLNGIDGGCLPLTSLLAADKNIPADKILVADPQRPHDWHPAYTTEQQAGINKLVKAQPLLAHISVGELDVFHKAGDHFICVQFFNRETARETLIFAGAGIHVEQYSEQLKGGPDVWLVGSFDDEKLKETIGAFFSLYDRLHTFLLLDTVSANRPSLAYAQAFNAMGLTVYTSGEEQPAE